MDVFVRKRTSSLTDKYEIYLLGEQIRSEMNAGFLIKDRKYHFRTYKHCFAGDETIDWLLQCKHCVSRRSAVTNMRILQNHGLFHHVCDDHKFKDEALFYRFRIEDNTVTDQDLLLFHKAKKLYKILTSPRMGIVRDYSIRGQTTFHDAFIGSVFVDWLVDNTEAATVDEAIKLGRRLLEINMIKHVTDDHHFRNDDTLLYMFCFDFERRRALSQISTFAVRGDRKSSRVSESSTDSSKEDLMSSNKSRLSIGSSLEVETDINLSQSLEDTDASQTEVNDENNPVLPVAPKSVLLRQVSADELESPDTPYVKQKLRIVSDSVGFGFVVRGSGPAYVQTVDPMGPAAEAGLKVRQYIHTVNNINVLRRSHKEVGEAIKSNGGGVLDMVVLVHKREAGL